MRKRKLILENGHEFEGIGFGADTDVANETVCCTMMTGYQEIISDPGYYGKIIIMTYPVIGSVGLTDEDYESKSLTAGGLIIRDYINAPSHYRFTKTLSDGMEEFGMPGIYGIDTRSVARILSRQGNMLAVIADSDASQERIKKLFSSYDKGSPIAGVSCKKPWYSRTSNYRCNVVAVDCGITNSTIKSLNARGCNVIIVPYDMHAREILALRPDGVLVSGGPEIPFSKNLVSGMLDGIIGNVPVFGIGQGCLTVAEACGAKSYKMEKSHHGSNHPVRNLDNHKVEITVQNHSFAIEEKSLAAAGFSVTHRNLCDSTVEGIENREKLVFAVHFHPESAPDAVDGSYHYDKFISEIDDFMIKRGEFDA